MDVILVRTQYPSNIGASARAMANMGANRLILIEPKCEINEAAHQAAAGAQAQLNGAIQYPSWEEFYRTEGEGIRIALTRRTGHDRKTFALEDTLSDISNEVFNRGRLYFVFGPEANGLAAEDLAYVNFACSLPTYGEFNSLNLAQAVLLTLSHARRLLPNSKARTPAHFPHAVQPFYFPDQLIKDWLTAMGFDIRARRSSAYLTLRRVLLQNQPTRHEIQVLEAILQQNLRKLKELNSGAVSRACDETTDSPPQ